MKLSSMCNEDQMQSNVQILMSLAAFYIELEHFCCSLTVTLACVWAYRFSNELKELRVINTCYGLYTRTSLIRTQVPALTYARAKVSIQKCLLTSRYMWALKQVILHAARQYYERIRHTSNFLNPYINGILFVCCEKAQCADWATWPSFTKYLSL